MSMGNQSNILPIANFHAIFLRVVLGLHPFSIPLAMVHPLGARSYASVAQDPPSVRSMNASASNAAAKADEAGANRHEPDNRA